MKKNILSMITAFIFTGCVFYSAPSEDLRYSTTVALEDLAGIYKNAGEPNGYLSKILFTPEQIKSKGTAHEEIELIKVTVSGDTVSVQAITKECKSFTKAFLAGRDFEIENAKIVLKQETALLSRGVGDPLVGPSYEKRIITLDQSGHGIYQNEVLAAGLVFLLVPTVVSDTSEIRFEKLTSMPISVQCNDIDEASEPITKP